MIETGLAVARWLQFAAAASLCGAPAFCLYGMAPDTRRAERSWLRRLLVGAAALAVVAALMLVLFESAEMTGDLASALDPGTIWSVISGTYFGAVWGMRLALLLMLSVGVWAFFDRQGGIVLIVLLGLTVAASLAWQGHGGEGGAGLGVLHRVADIAHLVAASVWLGALVVLVHLLRGANRDAGSAQNALYGLSRFSGVGALVVAALIASGGVNAWLVTAPRSVTAALATPYAAVLGMKLALFGGMLVLAALNRFLLTPKLERALVQGADARAALVTVRQSVVIETALAALVLVAVSVLGVMEPPSVG